MFLFLLVHPLRLVVLILVEILPNIIENSATLLRGKIARKHTKSREIIIREKLYKVEKE